jgi:hypothetical protein
MPVLKNALNCFVGAKSVPRMKSGLLIFVVHYVM